MNSNLYEMPIEIKRHFEELSMVNVYINKYYYIIYLYFKYIFITI